MTWEAWNLSVVLLFHGKVSLSFPSHLLGLNSIFVSQQLLCFPLLCLEIWCFKAEGKTGGEKSQENINEWSKMSDKSCPCEQGGMRILFLSPSEGFMLRSPPTEHRDSTQILVTQAEFAAHPYLSKKQIINWKLECFLTTAELQMNSDTQQRPFPYITPKVYFFATLSLELLRNQDLEYFLFVAVIFLGR